MSATVTDNIDPVAAVRWYLTRPNTPLNDLVGERISTTGENMGNTQGAFVVMVRRGGDSFRRNVTIKPFIRFRCYGGPFRVDQWPGGPIKANAVHLALRALLNDRYMIDTPHGRILACTEQQAPQDLVDPATRWPYVQAFYQVEMSGYINPVFDN